MSYDSPNRRAYRPTSTVSLHCQSQDALLCRYGSRRRARALPPVRGSRNSCQSAAHPKRSKSAASLAGIRCHAPPASPGRRSWADTAPTVGGIEPRSREPRPTQGAEGAGCRTVRHPRSAPEVAHDKTNCPARSGGAKKYEVPFGHAEGRPDARSWRRPAGHAYLRSGLDRSQPAPHGLDGRKRTEHHE